MNVIFVNTATKSRIVKVIAPSYIAIGSFCDNGEVYNVVTFKSAVVAFCK